MNHFSVVAALFAVAILFSCCTENTSLRKEVSGDVNPSITFKIGVPKGDPVTYETQDAVEAAIKSLYLYQFDSDQKLIAEPISIVVGDGINSELKNVSDGYTYQQDLDPTKKGMYYFYLVANETASDLMTVGKSIDDLKAILMNKTLTDNTSCDILLTDDAFPMTGVATKFGSELIPLTNDAISVNVELNRVFARLDIKNNMEGLVITDVRVVKANPQSYLFQNKVGEKFTVPTDLEQVADVLPFTAMPLPVFNKGQEMNKAFYLYENNQSSIEKVTRVEVAGILSGTNVLYSIPFWKEYTEITIKRNHLYHLIIGDGSEKIPDVHADAVFTLTDKDWNEQTEIEGFEVISVTYTLVDGTHYDIKKHELTVDNKAYSNLSFDLSTLYTNHTKFTATVTDAPAWINTTIIDSKLTINVTANDVVDAAPRKAEIKIVSDANPSDTYIISIIQGNPIK